MLAQLGIFLAEAAGDAHAEAEKEAINPVLPKLHEIFWAAVFFLALLALMRYVLLPPIRQLIAERDGKIRGDLASAERTRDELVSARAAYDQALAGARGEANALIDQARQEAEARRTELFAGVEAEIAEMRAAAQEEINEARARALSGLRSDVVDLSVSAASRVIGSPLDRATNAPIVERVLGQK